MYEPGDIVMITDTSGSLTVPLWLTDDEVDISVLFRLSANPNDLFVVLGTLVNSNGYNKVMHLASGAIGFLDQRAVLSKL